MAITTTAPRNTTPARRSAANDEIYATTRSTLKRKANTDDDKVKTLKPRGAKSKDNNDKITKIPSHARGNKAQKNRTEDATSTTKDDTQTDNEINANKHPTTCGEKNKAKTDDDNNKAPPVANDEAKTALKTEGLHNASKNSGRDQQPNKSEHKDNSQQTSKNDNSSALESSSDRNHSSTQGLTTPGKGTTVSAHGIFHFGKTRIFFFFITNNVPMSKSSQMTLSNTKSSQKTFHKGCTRISLEIKPVMLPFLHRLKLTKNTIASSHMWLPLITTLLTK